MNENSRIHDEDTPNYELPVLAEKRLPQAIRFPLVAHCDEHELLAVVLTSWDVHVFRLITGQVAFSIKREDECKVTTLHWTNDGRNLYVAWSNGTYVLYSGENGKLLNQSNIRADVREDDWRLDLKPDWGPDGDDEDDGPKVSCFGLATDRVATTAEKAAAPKDAIVSESKLTTDDWALGLADEDGDEDGGSLGYHGSATSRESLQKAALPDLPTAITTLDITRMLPKLSAIPAHAMPYAKAGPVGNKFSSQLAMEGIFDTEKTITPGLVQSLLVCQDGGKVQILLDDTVKIGTCPIPGQPRAHAALSGEPRHAILSDAADASLQLSYVDLPLQVLSSPLLYVIATNTKRIQNLLDYIMHTIRCLEHDYASSLQLPARLLARLDEMLEGQQEGDSMLNLYHLAMTGDFKPPVLEWLTDILKDTNHKRWDVAIAAMYTNLQNHIFMNLLPALDRYSIAVITLRSHAEYHEGARTFDCPTQLFSNMLDNIDSLRIVAQKLQLTVIDEQRQFQAFSRWLRLQIELGNAEPLSTSALETEAREVPSLDYALILTYIRRTMKQSLVERHILPRPSMTGSHAMRDFFQHPTIQQLAYEETKACITKLDALRADQPLSAKGIRDPESLVNLPAIAAALKGQTRAALERITEWQSQMLAPPTTTPLHLPASAKVFDMILTSSFHEPPPPNPLVLLLALDATDDTHLTLITAQSPPPTSPSRTPHPPAHTTTATTTIPLPPNTEVLDARFLPFPLPIARPFSPPTTLAPSPTHPRDLSILLLTRHLSPNHPSSLAEHIFTLTYQSIPPPSSQHSLPALPPSQPLHTFTPSTTAIHLDPTHIHNPLQHAELCFRPACFRLGSREGRNRVCILFDDRGREWRVLDLDAAMVERRGVAAAAAAAAE